MTNPKLRAADDINRFLRMFSGLKEYAAELEKGGSLEQAADEAERRRKKAHDDADKLDTERTAVLAKAQQDADKILADANRKLTEATKNAEKQLAGARTDAQRITDIATADIRSKQAEAQAELSRVEGAVANARRSLEAINADINDFKVQRNAIVEEVRAGRERLDGINREIAAMRARFEKV